MKPVVLAPQSSGPLMVKLKRDDWAVAWNRPWWLRVKGLEVPPKACEVVMSINHAQQVFVHLGAVPPGVQFDVAAQGELRRGRGESHQGHQKCHKDKSFHCNPPLS
jgi:hypothetical protein